MENLEHLALLKQDINDWNRWRAEHSKIVPDLRRAELRYAGLSRADLSDADLSDADLSDANLSGADLSGADLSGADLSGADLNRADLNRADLNRADLSDAYLINAHLITADLSGANLSFADFSDANLFRAHLNGANLINANLINAYLSGANLSGAGLSGANLSGANLSFANLSGADLSGARLDSTILVRTNLTNTTLENCLVYGISAWDVQLDGAKQVNLMITPSDQPTITVDNLKIAQFIYLLLNNAEIREVIDTITSKVVLILGRFTPERKAILDALRGALRTRNYSPILFDFEIPKSRDITETVSLLARMARFVIADLTDAKSIPQELSTIIPDLPSVPVQPLASDRGYSMFEHFRRYPWVLKDYYYTSVDDLLLALKEHIIDPAEQKAQELKKR